MNPNDEAPFSAEEIDEQIDFATEGLWSKLPSDMPTPDLRMIEDLQRVYPSDDEEMAQALERVRQRLAQVTSDSRELQPVQWRWPTNQPQLEYALGQVPPHMPPGGSQLRSIPASLLAVISVVLLVSVIGSLTVGFLLGRQQQPFVPNPLTATPQATSMPAPTPTLQPTIAPTLAPTPPTSNLPCPVVRPQGGGPPTTTARAAGVTITEFPIPTSESGPVEIAVGPDGNLWFTECQAKQIARMTPAGVVLEYPVRSFGEANPVDIIAGPDGYLWYTQRFLGQIGHMGTNGLTTEEGIREDSTTYDIAAGPDKNFWVTETFDNKIGLFTPDFSFAHEYAVPTANSQPYGITAGPDGNLWFTEHQGNKIGRLNPDGAIAEFPLPTANSGPDEITAGPDGNLWFTEDNAHKIGRITPAGVITEFSVSGIDGLENGWITSGPDGNLWFTVPGDNLIGRITLNGSISTFEVPTTDAAPEGIISGPNGTLWFAEFATNKIGKITL